MRGARTALYGWVIVMTAALSMGTAPHSFAQEIVPTGEYKEGLPIGAWMLYPQLFVGVVYDNNFDQSSSGMERDAGTSVRVVPRLVSTRDGGIHKTTLYGVADARFFDADTISATAGFSHRYEAMRDLVFNFNGNYTRQTDIFTSALNFNNGAIGPTGTPPNNIPIVINPFGTTPSVNPSAYNQFAGGASVTKTFDSAFMSLTGTAFHIAFDRSIPFNTSQDDTSVWISGRFGYHFVPRLYGFVETTAIWQRFNNSLFDTNGYRILGGLGSDDQYSLLRGEVYGGYQFQHQQQDSIRSGALQNADSAVFGGRLYYYPTRYLTLIASVDQTLGMSTMLTPSVPAGTPTLVTTAVLQTTYNLARRWSVGARLGYTRGDYFNIDRLDNGWMAGASFNYEVWRNLHVTLDYQYSTMQSNVTLNEFTRDVFSAGLTYRY